MSLERVQKKKAEPPAEEPANGAASSPVDLKTLLTWPKRTEVIKRLKVSPGTLAKWVREGALTPVNIPGYDERYDPADIEAIAGDESIAITQVVKVQTEALQAAYESFEKMVKILTEPAVKFAELVRQMESGRIEREQALEKRHLDVLQLYEKLMSDHADRELQQRRAERSEARLDAGMQQLMAVGPTLLSQVVASFQQRDIATFVMSLSEEQLQAAEVSELLSKAQVDLIRKLRGAVGAAADQEKKENEQ